jgi:hypothetical protein
MAIPRPRVKANFRCGSGGGPTDRRRIRDRQIYVIVNEIIVGEPVHLLANPLYHADRDALGLQ